MCSPSRTHHEKHAFTLVELLVVIGIIALLISILLPALNKARQQAQSTTCMSNLRQVGIAYRFYAEANRGLMPYILNRSWDSMIGPPSDGNRLYWCRALAQYMTKGYDPISTSGKDLPKVFKACPTWNQWIEANDPGADWTPGYGQNLYMFAGYTPNKKIPSGTRIKSVPNTGGAGVNIGIDSQSEANATNTSVDTYCIGQIQLARIPSPATRIIAGDAVQYWMGVGWDYSSQQSSWGLTNDLRMDFNRANQLPSNITTGQNAVAVFAVTGWAGGHPNRHGGDFKDCRADAKGVGPTKAKANYLFADGHVMSLSYLEARRAMQPQ